jgi:uncharacterized SAM-binding protein YcdF (DUF218 family)
MASLPPVPPRILTGSSRSTLSPVFLLIFGSVLLITLICLGVSLYLSMQIPSDAIQNLDEKVLAVFTMGCGAIIGLLGGKAIA